jgi:hypothetical protein
VCNSEADSFYHESPMCSNSKLKCITIGFACVLVAQSSLAQVHASMKALDEADLSVDWMKSNLGLTDEQYYVISVLNARYSVRFDSIRRSSSDRYVKFQKTLRVKQQRDNELKFILSEKQFRIHRQEQDRMNTVLSHHQVDH